MSFATSPAAPEADLIDAVKGNPVAWFSPTNKLMADTWRELRATLAPVMRDKSEQEKRIELLSGGVIDLWSLDSPDAGRGRKYAVVVIDEAAMIPMLEQAWQQAMRPTLTDLQGSAWFLSTPKGMNYFKTLFNHGQDPERADWASWLMPTSANPFILSQEIEAARLDLTEAAFNQEYLAQFVNWEGSVFRRVTEAATAAEKTVPESGHAYVIGCDWGRAKDYTVFVVLDTTTHAMVAMHRSNQVDYALQRGRLRALYDLWHPQQVIAEQNSIGQPVIEQLTRDGLRIQPFTTTNASKAQAVEALALAFERGDIRILNDAVLVSELVAYQAERLPSGLMRYTAPSGQHDDCVTALAIAWSAVSGQHLAVYPVPESDLIVPPFEIPAHWPRCLWTGHRLERHGGHLGSAGSRIRCDVPLPGILQHRPRTTGSCAGHRQWRGVGSWRHGPCRERPQPGGWAPADLHVLRLTESRII
jgi:terminase large subunit-like protein